MGIFGFFGIPFKVTNVTTKSYQSYYWTPKIAKNGPKQHNNLFFCLEVGPRNGPYLLVIHNDLILVIQLFNLLIGVKVLNPIQ